MKPFLNILILSFSLATLKPANAQTEELQQLVLNIQKLNQLRAILDNMYKGYQVLTKGYNTIKDLAQGNFSLHETFLDGLLQVSPTVKKYKRVAEIISLQLQLSRECKEALKQCLSSEAFNHDELLYLQEVYKNLVHRSLENLDGLLMIITSGQLRMNDAERLSAIDLLYGEMEDKLQFLRHFNDKTTLILVQRRKELKDVNDFSRMFGIKD